MFLIFARYVCHVFENPIQAAQVYIYICNLWIYIFLTYNVINPTFSVLTIVYNHNTFYLQKRALAITKLGSQFSRLSQKLVLILLADSLVTHKILFTIKSTFCYIFLCSQAICLSVFFLFLLMHFQ